MTLTARCFIYSHRQNYSTVSDKFDFYSSSKVALKKKTHQKQGIMLIILVHSPSCFLVLKGSSEASHEGAVN